MNTTAEFNDTTPEENTPFTVEQIRDNEATEEQMQQVENEMGDNWPRIVALALVLGISYEQARDEIQEEYDETRYSYGDEEYLVVTDDEAEKLWEENLQNYVDEVVLPEIPEHYRQYFNEESFIDDAKGDGRGHSLGRYDGEETEVKIDDTTYFIYRIN